MADPGIADEPAVSPEVRCEAVEVAEAVGVPGNATVDSEVSGLPEAEVEDLGGERQADAGLGPLFAGVVELEELEDFLRLLLG